MPENNTQEKVLCASNSYVKKFYLGEDFMSLPTSIKEELQIMCVLYTEDIGGVLELVFDEEGDLEFRTSYEDGDYYFDEIGSVLKIKQIRNQKRDLLEGLESFYKIKFLGKQEDL